MFLKCLGNLYFLLHSIIYQVSRHLILNPKCLSRVYEYFYLFAVQTGASLAKIKNVRNQIKLTMAVAAETRVNVVLKTPKV